MLDLAKALAICGAFILASTAVGQATPEPERQAVLIHQIKHDCGSCHGLTMKGGLGPPLLPSNLAAKPNDFLVQVILEGSPGTPMPPWGTELTAAEASWIVELLKDGLPP